VLLLGESGAGKEVAARALHRLSGRSGPFVPVNCGALSESLAESLLFGHVAGAFTGARAQPGFFRAAQGGTLFLDEIGELPPALQPKLLRALEERAVVPVGATAAVPCDVRLLAATNRDLQQAVRHKEFRGDLYARLAEIVLGVPPLRERREDVLMLLLCAYGPPAPLLTSRLVDALLRYAWPFNVREVFKLATQLRVCGAEPPLDLDLVADRLGEVAGAEEGQEDEADVGTETRTGEPGRAPPPDREQLISLLLQHKGVVSQAAQAIGWSRRQVHRWIAQHGIDLRTLRRPAREG
jgi:transcriptional regulator with PAS, ATPase and Fis domain